MVRRGIAHRGVFAAEAEVVKRRRKEAIDSEGKGRGKNEPVTERNSAEFRVDVDVENL